MSNKLKNLLYNFQIITFGFSIEDMFVVIEVCMYIFIQSPFNTFSKIHEILSCHTAQKIEKIIQ